MKYEFDDLSDLKDLPRDRAYGLVRSFLEIALEQSRSELEKPGDQEKTAELRGRISGLRIAIAAPERVLQEAREELKRGKGAEG